MTMMFWTALAAVAVAVTNAATTTTRSSNMSTSTTTTTTTTMAPMTGSPTPGKWKPVEHLTMSNMCTTPSPPLSAPNPDALARVACYVPLNESLCAADRYIRLAWGNDQWSPYNVPVYCNGSIGSPPDRCWSLFPEIAQLIGFNRSYLAVDIMRSAANLTINTAIIRRLEQNVTAVLGYFTAIKVNCTMTVVSSAVFEDTRAAVNAAASSSLCFRDASLLTWCLSLAIISVCSASL